jgi:hypothetical protein
MDIIPVTIYEVTSGINRFSSDLFETEELANEYVTSLKLGASSGVTTRPRTLWKRNNNV